MGTNRNLRWEDMDKSNTDLSVVMRHIEVHNKTEWKSPRTVGWYNEVLDMFIKWLKEDGSSTAIGDIDEYTVRRFILHIEERPGIKGPMSTHTVANRVRLLKLFFSWLAILGNISIMRRHFHVDRVSTLYENIGNQYC
jgi:site-specific recombinase XerD